LLNVAHISFFLDPQRRSPAQILHDWWPLVVSAEMVAQAGARVTVIQACRQRDRVTRNGVRYEFVPPESARGRLATSSAFTELIQGLQADVFHVHGLGFPDDVLALRRLAPHTPMLLQDHADRIPPMWRRRVFRRALSVAAGISFCALAQSRPFRDAGFIGGHTDVFEIAEVSSPFFPGDRDTARRAVAVYGDPAVLWVGHLDENKDPLTALEGISAAAQQLPHLQLWCCYGSGTLLPEVRAAIDRDPRLTGRVHLIGKVAHTEIEQYMRAADLFVLGSHREGSGVAVIEALACGLPPVVTDIASFRMLTDNGRIGGLWPCGDAAALGAALVSVAARPPDESRHAARAHFDRELSVAAVGRKMLAAYRIVIERRLALTPA
jgi:glycosyltransferase involved in cell wall biosynthesis